MSQIDTSYVDLSAAEPPESSANVAVYGDGVVACGDQLLGDSLWIRVREEPEEMQRGFST
jgi:hypothetical protein